MSNLLARLRAQREFKVEVEPKKCLLVRRPLEWEFAQFSNGVAPEKMMPFIVGWEGFTEADLLGANLASPDPAEFSPELIAELLGDRVRWFETVANALVNAMTDHIKKRAELSKN